MTREMSFPDNKQARLLNTIKEHQEIEYLYEHLLCHIMVPDMEIVLS